MSWSFGCQAGGSKGESCPSTISNSKPAVIAVAGGMAILLSYLSGMGVLSCTQLCSTSTLPDLRYLHSGRGEVECVGVGCCGGFGWGVWNSTCTQLGVIAVATNPFQTSKTL